MRPVYVVKHRDGRYLYAGTGPRDSHMLTRQQRAARRFASLLEAWGWVVRRSYNGTTSFYRPVRLAGPRCRCAR